MSIEEYPGARVNEGLVLRAVDGLHRRTGELNAAAAELEGKPLRRFGSRRAGDERGGEQCQK